MKRISVFAIICAVAFLPACGSRNSKTVQETPAEEKTVISFAPGDTLTVDFAALAGLDTFFTAQPIPDDIFALMQGKTFKADCTIPRDSLRYITCLHKDLDGNILVGEMVTDKNIAGDLLEIFRELYVQSYPIEKMRLPDYWDASDEAQMRANNSSCFNYRPVSHTTKVSKHGRGIAVDINPLYNPYVKTLKDGTESVEPATGKPYLKRDADFPYKLVKGDLCYRLFIEHGFKWGGNWTNSKDYQHFEL